MTAAVRPVVLGLVVGSTFFGAEFFGAAFFGAAVSQASAAGAEPGAPEGLRAAWERTSNEGRAYLSLKLDDPSFTAPIFANLFEDDGEDTHSLIWSRPRKAANE